jgi:hypothetical protein
MFAVFKAQKSQMTEKYAYIQIHRNWSCNFQVPLTPTNRMKYMKADITSYSPNLNSATRVTFEMSEFHTLLNILDAARTCEGYNKQDSPRCRSCEHAAPAFTVALPENTISIRENRMG